MKRKTKAQHQQEQRAALVRRVTDVYSGAQGSAWDQGSDFATAEILTRVVPVLETMFGTEDTNYMFNVHCLHHFDNPEAAAEHLFNHGVRV